MKKNRYIFKFFNENENFPEKEFVALKKIASWSTKKTVFFLCFCQNMCQTLRDFVKTLWVFMHCGIIKGLFHQTLNTLVLLNNFI